MPATCLFANVQQNIIKIRTLKPVKINPHKNQKPPTNTNRVHAALAKLKELQKSSYLPFLKQPAGNCLQKIFFQKWILRSCPQSIGKSKNVSGQHLQCLAIRAVKAWRVTSRYCRWWGILYSSARNHCLAF